MTRFRELLKAHPVLPAPMCGISDRATREVQRDLGAGLAFTQMISMEGLYRRDKNSTLLMDIESEGPLAGVQLFGNSALSAGEAARIARDRGATVIDFNMGCPAKKVTENNCGSALLRHPRLVGEIVGAAVRGCEGVPFTVKMRWDWDEGGNSALEIAKVCEDAGAQAVCLHARTREARFGGRAVWERIGELRERLSIPVIGNGDIREPQDAVDMMRQTGCEAVMLGRGLIGNPWLLPDAVKALVAAGLAGPEALEAMNAARSLADCADEPEESEGGLFGAPTLMQRLEIMRKHARRMVVHKGEVRGLKEFRKHAAAYLKGQPHACALKQEIFGIDTLDELDRMFPRIQEIIAAGIWKSEDEPEFAA